MILGKCILFSYFSGRVCSNSMERSLLSQAADALKIDGKQLLDFRVVDEIVQEPVGGAHRDWDTTAEIITKSIEEALSQLVDSKELLSSRYEKFRIMGKIPRCIIN